jgi:hypothetical protein
MTFRACSSPALTPVKLQPAHAILNQESVHTTLSITHHTRKRPSTGPRTTHGPQFVMVSLDGILIYSPTLAHHEEHLQKVFEVLRCNKIYLKWSNSSFAKSKLEYLGHIISIDGVATDPTKNNSHDEMAQTN